MVASARDSDVEVRKGLRGTGKGLFEFLSFSRKFFTLAENLISPFLTRSSDPT